MRSLVGVGTPRSLQGHLATIVALVIALWTRGERRWRDHHTPSDDQASVFTPNHRFELLPVGASEGDLSPRAARSLRAQTLEAFKLALQSRLLFLESRTAEVIVLSESPPRSLPQSVQPLLRNAEKLGTWAGGVSLFELGTVLQVGF